MSTPSRTVCDGPALLLSPAFPTFHHRRFNALIRDPNSIRFAESHARTRAARASVPVTIFRAIEIISTDLSQVEENREKGGKERRKRGREGGRLRTKRRRVIRDNRGHVFGRHKSHYRDDGSRSSARARLCARYSFSFRSFFAAPEYRPDVYTRARAAPSSPRLLLPFLRPRRGFCVRRKKRPARDSSSSSGASHSLSHYLRCRSKLEPLLGDATQRHLSFRRPGNYQPTKTRFLSAPTRDACLGKNERERERIFAAAADESGRGSCFAVSQPLNRVASRIIIARPRDENLPLWRYLIVRRHLVARFQQLRVRRRVVISRNAIKHNASI